MTKQVSIAILYAVIAAATALVPLANNKGWESITTPTAVLAALIAAANSTKAFFDPTVRQQRKGD